MSARYQVLKGSQSGHCCFSFSVIDTERAAPVPNLPDFHMGEPRVYLTVCECTEENEARLICEAMNHSHVKIPPSVEILYYDTQRR